MNRIAALLLLSLFPATAKAEPPNVVVDIAPIHSLTARVMSDVGQPELLLSPNVTPHQYALRPSDAAKLEAADIVFWVGADLTPWLRQPLATLSSGATVFTLSEVAGTEVRPYRSLHSTTASPDHSGADHADEHEDEHVAGSLDPHMWLDPDNAGIWLQAIATALAAADSENAARYLANAEQGRQEIAAVRDEISASLRGKSTDQFIVYHDAYQYFEHHFGLQAAGAVAEGDAYAPGAARIAAIRRQITDSHATCLLTEPQFSQSIVAALTEGHNIRVAVLDPLGAALRPGKTLYPEMLERLGNTMAACLPDE